MSFVRGKDAGDAMVGPQAGGTRAIKIAPRGLRATKPVCTGWVLVDDDRAWQPHHGEPTRIPPRDPFANAQSAQADFVAAVPPLGANLFARVPPAPRLSRARAAFLACAISIHE